MIRAAAALALAVSSLIGPPTADAVTLFELVNATRVEHGAAPVAHSADLAFIAQYWADEMASGRAAYGHNPDVFDQIPGGWVAAAENIAWRSEDNPLAIHQQWIDSAPHFENMLRPWTHAGTGYARGHDGRWYGVQVYAYYLRAMPEVILETHDLAVTVDPPGGDLAPGEQDELEIVVANLGETTAPRHQVTVYAPDGIVLDGGERSVTFHRDLALPPRSSYTVYAPFTVGDDVQPGATLLVVIAVEKNAGDSDRDNDSAVAVVTVVPIETEDADEEVLEEEPIDDGDDWPEDIEYEDEEPEAEEADEEAEEEPAEEEDTAPVAPEKPETPEPQPDLVGRTPIMLEIPQLEAPVAPQERLDSVAFPEEDQPVSDAPGPAQQPGKAQTAISGGVEAPEPVAGPQETATQREGLVAPTLIIRSQPHEALPAPIRLSLIFGGVALIGGAGVAAAVVLRSRGGARRVHGGHEYL